MPPERDRDRLARARLRTAGFSTADEDDARVCIFLSAGTKFFSADIYVRKPIGLAQSGQRPRRSGPCRVRLPVGLAGVADHEEGSSGGLPADRHASAFGEAQTQSLNVSV